MKRNGEVKNKEEPANKKVKKSVSFGKDAPAKKGKFEKFPAAKPGMIKDGQNRQASATEKPDWGKFKQDKKDLKEKRKAQKLENVYDLAVKAKQIGEKLRRSDCSKEDKDELSTKLYKLFEGNFEKLIFTHDMSRIIQWLIKFCNQEMRQSILNELKTKIVEIFHSKYAKNCIKKMLKYGTESMRQEILLACSGHVVELVSNVLSAPLIDTAYKNWATEETKTHLKQEFYGGMYKNSKDKNVKTLSDVFKNSPDMKSATLSAVKMNLVRVLNKNIFDNAIVQAILVEFFAECSNEDRDEIIVMLRSSIAELSHNKDGAQIAMMCIWHGTTKDRKLSLKSIKDHVKDIAISEHGHIILIACFDSIDDTTLMKKILFPEIVNDLKDIVANEYGRKVILYLVARRDTHHFHPSFIQELQKGDGNANSKKPADIRAKELLEAISNPLYDAIATDPLFWLANGSTAMVTLAILKAGQGENLKKAFEAIATTLTNPELQLKDNKTDYKVIEHPGLHMMFKKLIQADKGLAEEGKITFGEELISKLDDDEIKRWLNFNRACFLLVLMLENEPEQVTSVLLSKLKEHSKLIKSKKGSGASILLKKL